MTMKVQELEKDVDLYATALAVYKADELFDQLADNGDPFPLLAALEPDEVPPFQYWISLLITLRHTLSIKVFKGTYPNMDIT